MNIATKPFRAVPQDADTIHIRAVGFSPYPSYRVILGRFIPAVPEVPPTPAKSGPNLPDYVPPQPGRPGEDAKLVAHIEYVFTMSADDWNKWGSTTNDDAYVRSFVLRELAKAGHSITPR